MSGAFAPLPPPPLIPSAPPLSPPPILHPKHANTGVSIISRGALVSGNGTLSRGKGNYDKECLTFFVFLRADFGERGGRAKEVDGIVDAPLAGMMLAVHL